MNKKKKRNKKTNEYFQLLSFYITFLNFFFFKKKKNLPPAPHFGGLGLCTYFTSFMILTEKVIIYNLKAFSLWLYK